jgi:hypothetical protein
MARKRAVPAVPDKPTRGTKPERAQAHSEPGPMDQFDLRYAFAGPREHDEAVEAVRRRGSRTAWGPRRRLGAVETLGNTANRKSGPLEFSETISSFWEPRACLEECRCLCRLECVSGTVGNECRPAHRVRRGQPRSPSPHQAAVPPPVSPATPAPPPSHPSSVRPEPTPTTSTPPTILNALNHSRHCEITTARRASIRGRWLANRNRPIPQRMTIV